MPDLKWYTLGKCLGSQHFKHTPRPRRGEAGPAGVEPATTKTGRVYRSATELRAERQPTGAAPAGNENPIFNLAAWHAASPPLPVLGLSEQLYR